MRQVEKIRMQNKEEDREIIYDPEHVKVLEKSPLAGMHFCFLGSSVTYGSAAGGVSFVEYICKRNGYSFVKEAVSGTTLVDNGPDSYIQRMLRNISPEERFDAFVCQLSTNDAARNLPLGRMMPKCAEDECPSFRRDTIIGALEYIIAYVQKTWKCPVICYTGTKFENPLYGQMVEALYDLRKKWKIGIIDLWNDPQMGMVSETEYGHYMQDPVHPTRAGYLDWWTPKMEQQLYRICLHQAILAGDTDRVRKILEAEPALVDEKDPEGVLMALLAAKTGSLALVRYIVEYSRASMNIFDDCHRSMLHYGVMSGSLEVCRYLVEKVGMSPLEGDLHLQTPYELAHQLAGEGRCGLKLIEDYFQEIVGAPLERMYKNPIRTGFFPDPSIVRVGRDYYMVNSTFVYFPCIPVSHSRDLIHWKIIGYAITEPEWAMLDDLEGGRGFWAPDISYYNGKFYIAATYRMNDNGTVYRKQFVVSSEKPEGPYSKPAIIPEDGIDPSIFNDDDGRRYMLLNRGARILELNEDATEQISEAEMLYYGDHKRAPEGPHLLKKDGYYYLFEAEGGTGPGHRITVSRSRSLKGRYEPCPYNPIMRQTDEGAMLQRCGHGKPVQTAEGQWYMVYLCGRKLVGRNGEQCSMLGRETALDPITWTADGWPIVNQLKGPSCLQIKPAISEAAGAAVEESSGTGVQESIVEGNCGSETQERTVEGNSGTGTQEKPAAEGFSAGTLYQTWMFVRAPEADGFTVAEGRLILKASAEDLDSMYARNILLRRQTDFAFTAQCKMLLPEMQPGQDAGVTCYYDENTYIKFGVFCKEDGLHIMVVEKIGDQVTAHFLAASPVAGSPVTESPVAEFPLTVSSAAEDAIQDPNEVQGKSIIFRMEVSGLERCFSYSLDGEKFHQAACLDNVYYLCDEGLKKGKRFTGAMLGMYAHAGHERDRCLRVTYEYFNYDSLLESCFR